MPKIDDPFSEQVLSEARPKIELEHREALAIGQECYARLCQRLGQTEYAEGSADEAVLALSLRLLELSAFSLLCLRNGSVPAAKIIIRSLLETAYRVCAIRHDFKNLEKYLVDDSAARLIECQSIHEYKKDRRGKSLAVGIEKKIDALSAQKPAALKAADWADLALMVDFHRLFYPWLSSDTHGNASALNHHFEPHRDNALTVGPFDEGLQMAVLILARILVVVLRALDSGSESDIADWFVNINERLDVLEV